MSVSQMASLSRFDFLGTVEAACMLHKFVQDNELVPCIRQSHLLSLWLQGLLRPSVPGLWGSRGLLAGIALHHWLRAEQKAIR